MAKAYVEIDDLELEPDEYLAYTGYSELAEAVDAFNKGDSASGGEIAYTSSEPFSPGIEILSAMNRKFGFPDKNGSML